MTIRKSTAADVPQIEALYPAAFPDEDLLPVVKALLGEPSGVLSLVAEADAAVAGHVAFTDCTVAGSKEKGAMLAPLAVAPRCQRQGVGGKLVNDGLRRLEEQGVSQVFVLGDPDYYGRFGFTAESKVRTPYEIPAEWAAAWQSLTLCSRGALGAGVLELPGLWMHPSLWLP